MERYIVKNQRMVEKRIKEEGERDREFWEKDKYGARGLINKNHAKTLLADLARQREAGEFLDVALEVEGKQFPCHRSVLATIPYFRTMFSSSFNESDTNVVKLQEIDCSSFSKILDFVYTGKIRISSSEAQHILKTADMLQIDSIRKYCQEVILENVDTSNCVGALHLAYSYNLPFLKTKARRIAVSNFSEVRQNEEFPSLSTEQLTDLLKDCRSCKMKSHIGDEVVLSVIQWIKHDPEIRKTEMVTMLELIELSGVRVSVLQQLESAVQESPECLAKITAAKEEQVPLG